MSCEGNSQFGYVKIEDDMVVCYTGESNNPTVHKFCNDDIVKAVKLFEIVKRIEERHGLSCDCGFCECLRVEQLKESKK